MKESSVVLAEGEALAIRRKMAYAELARSWHAWLIFPTEAKNCGDFWLACGMMTYLDKLGVPR